MAHFIKMFDESSSGYGDESPVLWKPRKKASLVKILDNMHRIGDPYHELLTHLEKKNKKKMSKKELQNYWKKISQLNSTDTKDRWALMRTRGLLGYMMKPRSEFMESIIKGEVTIYEKYSSQQNSISLVPSFSSQRTNLDTAEATLDLLTDNNFLTMDSNMVNITMETMKPNDGSEDMFASCQAETLKWNPVVSTYEEGTFKAPMAVIKVESNCELGKAFNDFNTYTILPLDCENLESTDCEMVTEKSEVIPAMYTPAEDEGIFKVPMAVTKVDKKCEPFNENLYAISSQHSEDLFSTGCEIAPSQQNMFDDLDGDDVLSGELDEIKQTMAFVLKKLEYLNANGSHMEQADTSVLNQSTSSTGKLKSYQNEENIRILRDACLQFRQNMEGNKDLNVLQELLES